MSKRDTDTELWNEDWFLGLDDVEMLFWFYLKDRCDQAGFWRPNFKIFEATTGRRINQQKFITKINSDSQRVVILDNGKWFLTGYIKFQFNGILSQRNNFHKSVYNTFRKNIPLENTTTYGFEYRESIGRVSGEVNKEQSKGVVSFKSLEDKKEDTVSGEAGISGPVENPVESSAPAIPSPVEQVIEHLNKKINGRYRVDSGGFITARLSDGFSVDDLVSVIDKKFTQWATDEKMHRLLRPSTLFHPVHFQEYLNEHNGPKPKKLEVVK